MRSSLPRALFCGIVPMLMQFATNAQANTLPSAPAAMQTQTAVSGSSPQTGASASAITSQPNLTLADAEERALKNQPRLLAEQFRAQAAKQSHP